MELIRKQVRMNQMGKTVTDQFMIGGDYNVPDAKSDVGRVLSGEGSLRIEETRRVENYLRVTGKLNFKVLYVTDSGDPRPGALEGMIPFEEMVYMEEENGRHCASSAGGMRGITDPFEKACGKSACGNDGTYRADHRKTGDT